MFSITGDLLPGSTARPDIINTVSCTITLGMYEDPETDCSTTRSLWNTLGYIPVVSTLTGCCRALLGIIHSIGHLASAIFSAVNRSSHLQEAKLGSMNFGRGLIEILPCVGNLTTYLIDKMRNNIYLKASEKIVEDHADTYNTLMTLFIYGEEFGRKSTNFIKDELEKLDKNKPSIADILRIYRLVEL